MASSSAAIESPMNSSSSPSKLAGMSPEATPPDQGGGDGEGKSGANAETSQLRTSIQKLRSMEMDLQSMTEQFPAAASALRQATTGLRSALRQIIANPGTPEPPTPRIGG